MSESGGIDWSQARAQGAGFIASGAIATAVDAGVLAVLTHWFGVDAFRARAVGIAVAMVVGYFAHRRLTFKVATPADLNEFARYLGVAAGVAILNYAIFAMVLFIAPDTPPLVAFFIATPIAMVCSYVGLRLRVFGGG